MLSRVLIMSKRPYRTVQVELVQTACYGIRVYTNTSWLANHVDTRSTHAVSVIMQVDQVRKQRRDIDGANLRSNASKNRWIYKPSSTWRSLIVPVLTLGSLY